MAHVRHMAARAHHPTPETRALIMKRCERGEWTRCLWEVPKWLNVLSHWIYIVKYHMILGEKFLKSFPGENFEKNQF